MKGAKKGFTIIEVILFLAISAMLFGIAFRYTSSSIRETRVRDTSDQFTSFMQRQFASVKNAESARPTTNDATCGAPAAVGASNTCAVLGKLLYFMPDNQTIRVSTIVGTPSDKSALAYPTDRSTLEASVPKVLSDTAGNIVVDEVFTLPWQSQLPLSARRYQKTDTSVANFNVITIQRSPISENTVYDTFEVTNDGTLASTYNDIVTAFGINANRLTYEHNGLWGPANDDRPAVLCVQYPGLSGRDVVITIEGGFRVGISKVTGGIRSSGDTLVGGLTCV